MKLILLTSLFLSSQAFAQSLDVNSLKSLLTQKQSILEKINPGMSKRMTTKYSIETDYGTCDMTMTADRTVLLVQDSKIIVYSQENYVTSGALSCTGLQNQTVTAVFYEDKPILASYIADLDASASQIESISKSGDLVTMSMHTDSTNEDGQTQTNEVTVKYDLSKPGFKNTILVQAESSSVVTSDIADVDVKKIDLTNVLFCESEDSDNCQMGDWSDIVY